MEELKDKMVEAFMQDNEKQRDGQFKKVITEHASEANELVLSIMQNIPKHNFGAAGKVFTVEQVLSEKHDRVMTKDNYRFHNDLYYAYQQEITLLDTFFSSFTVEQYPQEWQQILIKYVYRKLTNSVRTDRGLGVGTHPWEERPARTMIVEESILADKILANISDKENKFRNEPYRQALKVNNITSATWNYVGCKNDDESEIKLQIVETCLSNIPVSSRQEMVLCRYVGGLREVAQHNILVALGFNSNECINELMALPF
jgi:hypothetical protein